MVGVWESVVQEIGLRSEKVKMAGFVITLTPSLWDVLSLGLRGFFEWRVGTFGICVMFFGAIVMLFSEIIERWFRG